MKRIFLLLTVFLLLNGCGGFEFVYDINKEEHSLVGFTDINISGDDSNQIYIFLKDLIGDNKKNDPKYKLLVTSLKTESAQVIEKDATASKFKTQHFINYRLYNLLQKCIVFNNDITTTSSYNAKSAGYSFGTDISKKDSSNESLKKNIDEFITKINKTIKENTCN